MGGVGALLLLGLGRAALPPAAASSAAPATASPALAVLAVVGGPGLSPVGGLRARRAAGTAGGLLRG
ncbi:hypothetical protein C3V38_06335 [Dietzia sp. oral taxon 368]|nr:hypothetical protein C3V38_06335 [Dietzia sp. oral taxon 368]